MLFMFVFMGWDCVSALRPQKGLVFILQMIWVSKNSEKIGPSATSPTKNPTWSDLVANSGLRTLACYSVLHSASNWNGFIAGLVSRVMSIRASKQGGNVFTRSATISVSIQTERAIILEVFDQLHHLLSTYHELIPARNVSLAAMHVSASGSNVRY
jgi:hypothetical protein